MTYVPGDLVRIVEQSIFSREPLILWLFPRGGASLNKDGLDRWRSTGRLLPEDVSLVIACIKFETYTFLVLNPRGELGWCTGDRLRVVKPSR